MEENKEKVEEIVTEEPKEKGHKVNSYKAFAIQVEALLAQVNDRLANVGKKEALRLLEFALKFPVEHEEVVKKFSGERQIELVNFIQQVVTAKNNMVVTFLAEHGKEIQAEYNLQEAAKKEQEAEILTKDDLSEELAKSECDGNCCKDCECGGE